MLAKGERPQNVDLLRWNIAVPYAYKGTGNKQGGRLGDWSYDLEIRPWPWLRVESDAHLDPHIGKFATINADLVAHPKLVKGFGGRKISEVVDSKTGEIKDLPWAVGLGWRYQRKTSAQLTLETEFNLTDKWRAGIYQGFDVKRFVTETNVDETRTVKKIYDSPEYEYRLIRDLHEWTVELIYNVHRQQGDTVFLLFRLKAAPELPFNFERGYNQPKAGRNFPKR